MAQEPGDTTPWDENFEPEFQKADHNFPAIINWLDGLDRAGPPFERAITERITKLDVGEDQFGQLLECIISLAVRSPMHRQSSVSLAEDMRGTLSERERNRLIGANMRYSQRNAGKQIGARGKAMVIFSPEREFIFGDGFYHNFTVPTQHLYNPKMLVPLTPWMSVLYTKPSSYRTLPRLSTLTASQAETDSLNYAVQVYAQNAIYYRSERPTMTDAFAQGRHMVFANHRNSVDQLIHEIPGVPPPDRDLDLFADMFDGRNI